ncbi:MAG: ATP-dependent DNA helicase RecG [Nocardioidaceae bacterium]
MITRDSPIQAVLGDAPAAKRKAVVEGLGLQTVGDLLTHFPRRYLRTGELSRVSSLAVGQMLTVVGEIAQSTLKTYTDRRTNRPAYRVETTLHTNGAELKMTFFAKKAHLAEFFQRKFAVGQQGIFAGQVGRFGSTWQLTNPKSVLFSEDDADPDTFQVLHGAGGLYPIYPLSKGLDSWDLQRMVTFARTVVDDLPEILPAEVRDRQRLPDARQALDWIHAPADEGEAARARRRYQWEEALVTQLVLARRRAAIRAAGARARTGGGGLLAEFDARLPFELTTGQREIGATIEAELAREWPMNRLLQGEVGSGKTLVALRAMLRVVDSGGQAALLAPTEVLAQQHFRSMVDLLGDLAQGGMLGGAAEGTTVALLTGSQSTAQRRQALLDIASGAAGIVVGTHALLQEKVSFADLGLVVVDEQHRFGVEQRAALTDKAGTPPHLLVMTATPIPRTVAMTVFGDLEVSTLAELPAGRAPIQTNVVPLWDQPTWIARVWQRVREEVDAGRQAYVLCPRIDGDEGEYGLPDIVDFDDEGNPVTAPLNLASVEQTFGDLGLMDLNGLRLARMHGRLPADEKDAVMRAFAAGDVDVLVSTTVIEVGVDVPNATAMVILDADRFGVSQLHQIRGRVGRGGHAGLCLLVTRAEAGTPGRERLDAVASTTDGFRLSQIDLELRREGDVLGASQAGRRSSLQNLRVLRDEETIVAARTEAELLHDADPDLAAHPDLAAAVAALEISVESGFMEKS